jgi:endonuclease YncB( thermonuclease family)
MKRNIKILLALVFLLIIINYPFLDSLVSNALEDYEIGVVQRVIDGDTVKINNESVRLLGINSPERGEVGYLEAKQFMIDKISNETVRIRFGSDKYDRYYRKLGYIYFDGENVNLESVREGYSNFYFPSGKDSYYNSFVKAWEECLISEKNLCEKSDYYGCVSGEVISKNLKIVNVCSYKIVLEGWSVKDEGRKKYVFDSNASLGSGESIILTPEDFGKDYVWTASGDSVFIRDNENKLVFWNTW